MTRNHYLYVTMRYIFLIAVVFVFMCGTTVAQTEPRDRPEPPKSFCSDGCSMFPDGNYRHCCVAHDKDYYFGGTEKERAASDLRLYKCVKAQKGWYNKLVAPMMWVGVRVGGVSFLPTPFRWGFGKEKEKKMKKRSKQKLAAQL